MRDSVAGIWPLPFIKVEQVIGDHLLEVQQFQFLSGWPIHTIEVIGIEKAQLEQIEDGLLGPPICPPRNGIIIDHLIKLINPTHVVHVFSDEFRPLHHHLFVDESPSSFHPSSVGEIFRAGVECRADNRHQSYVLPNENHGVVLPAVRHLPTGQAFRLCLVLQVLGCSLWQPQCATVCFIFIQFLRQGHRRIVIVHEDMITLP